MWKALRRRAYTQLEPTAWPRRGFSPVNIALTLIIFITVASAVMETEPEVAAGHERWFMDFEATVGSVFALEYLARVWVAPENPRFAKWRFPRLRYMLTPIAIIDLLAVVPVFFEFSGGTTLLLRFFRVLRMLRLAKLGRTSRAWEHIRDAVKDYRYEFGLILLMLLMGTLISGSLLYWAEADAQPDKFGSIPRALWWAIVTMTTVGYGDVYPVTVLGRILGGFIAIMGVTLIALPAGLFAAAFTEAMQKHREHRDGGNGPDA